VAVRIWPGIAATVRLKPDATNDSPA